MRHVVNREARRSVIVRNRPCSSAGPNGRVVRIAQRDAEGLVAFIDAIVCDWDRNCRGRAPSRDQAWRIACDRVIAGGYRCPVRRRILEGGVEAAGCRLRDSEDRVAATFAHGHVADGDGRRGIIVRNRAGAGVCRDGRVARIAERDGEALTAFIKGIVYDRD